MTGIAEMFAELSGYPEYELALLTWAPRADERKRAMKNGYVQGWRRKHRDKHRGFTRKWRAKKPAHECYLCKSPRAPGKKACEAHLASDRAKSAARYAARKAAA